jgi:hypothetical protein
MACVWFDILLNGSHGVTLELLGKHADETTAQRRKYE